MQKMQEENVRVLEDAQKGQTYISGRFMTGIKETEKTGDPPLSTVKQYLHDRNEELIMPEPLEL
eukprot:15367159-Ditylum_brightwellii.AAC.2